MSVRAVDAMRVGLGVVALARPSVLVHVGGGHRSVDRRAVRVLGARYLVQAAAGSLVDRPWVSRADAAVDVTHAVSMVGIAALAPRHRRIALASAVVAVAFAAGDLLQPRGGVRDDRP